MFPSVLSLDVMDVSGTVESDNAVSVGAGRGGPKYMDLHKMRLSSNGRPLGRKEYLTPQSEELMGDGLSGGGMVNVNIHRAMQVRCVCARVSRL
jgi:hypothetical protein